MNAPEGEESTQDVGESATPGGLLRGARVRRQMSIQQAAEHLHLDLWAIEALETNQFGALGAPVYAKGYLRKYAALLGLAPDAIVARYAAMMDVPAEPTPIPVSASTIARTERISLKKPLLIAAALLTGVGLWWAIGVLLSSQDAQSPPRALHPSPAPHRPSPSPAADAAASPSRPPAEQAESAVLAQAPASSSAQIRLRLEYADESWTEVYDARDTRLLFGLGAPGRVRTLTGAAPLRVTLGAASAVKAYVNDQPIVIPRRVGRDASRFTIDAAGRVIPGVAANQEH
ncbi:MAG TPA: RodZ domain-containing protein [Steroidobacter sp.]|nr:RodZ domain-containing protein [Steroidobacter sp.]